VITNVNGYRGYYSGATFCSWVNNYCGTGQAYGIILPTIIQINGYYGYYTGITFCDWTNNYCGTGLYWGISDNGSVCDYTYCGGSIGSGGSTGGSTGGGGSTGTGGSTGGGGSTGTGGSTGGGGSTGTGTVGSSGSGSEGSSGSGGSTIGSSGSDGSTSGSSGSDGSTTGSSGSGSSGSSGSDGTDGVDSTSKDVNLQQANVLQQSVDTRAQALVSQFSMTFEAAQALTQLSDRMQTLNSSGQITDDDRMAIADAALGVAGIKTQDVNNALAVKIKTGDSTQLNALIDQGAANLGMPDSSALRNQILPSLGLPVQ
jgi:hypothetical protein